MVSQSMSPKPLYLDGTIESLLTKRPATKTEICLLAQLDEIAMYLYNNGIKLYSNQLISQRLKELQITNKKLSTKAFKAYSPANMRREFLFGTDGCQFVWLASPESILLMRVQTVGNYEKGQKLTVMIAVEPAGDPELPADVTGMIAQPRQWVDTNIDDWRVFLWDNLSSHYSPIVYETVMGRVGLTRFGILPCLAYQPKYGPIKYVICQLLNHMKVNVLEELDLNQMEQHILDLAAAIGPFNATFANCGYSEDGGPLGPPGAG
eukprot:jgi/Psemu1/7534/gm1.7534_g